MQDQQNRNQRTQSRHPPVWLISIVCHLIMLAAASVLVPVLVTYHQESFGPPIRVVERVEPEERPRPQWPREVEMPEQPMLEVVMEPVEEAEAERDLPLAEGDLAACRTGAARVSSAFALCSIGLRTRPRPMETPCNAVAVEAPPDRVHTPAPVPTPARAKEVPTVGGRSRAARVVSPPRPRYPERQRRAGRSAIVNLLVHIDSEGKPGDVEVLDQDIHADFARAAISAARCAGYEPALAEGKPVASTIRVRIRFQLR